MKFKHLFISTLLLGGAMVSCSDDLDVSNQGPGQILENETTTFVRVALNNPAGEGRATLDGFENGSDAENAVQSILLTFYDAAQNYVGRTTINVNDNTLVRDEDKTVERIITVIGTVQLPENVNYPRYVVAYVNPTSASSDLTTESLEDSRAFTRERNQVSPTAGYRTMNNSMYFNAAGVATYATTVDFKTHFFDNFEAAEKSDAATIDITVERMEAKVRMNKDIGSIDITPVNGSSTVIDEDDDEVAAPAYKLTFVPEAWFVNATEKNSFLIKNYRSVRENLGYGLDLSTVPASFTRDNLLARFNNPTIDGRTPMTASDFNNAALLRSYWAISPTYFYEDQPATSAGHGLYPKVSYNVNDGEVNVTEGHYYSLDYQSYRKAVKYATSNKYMGFEKVGDNTIKKFEYVLENTLSYQTLQSGDAKAAMTSVVILGHYVITDKDNNTVFDGADDANGQPKETQEFYVRHELDGSKYVMLSDEEALDFFLERSNTTFFVQQRYGNDSPEQAGQVVPGQFVPLKAAHLDNAAFPVNRTDFRLVYPKTDLTHGRVLSEQWRTLALTTEGEANQNIYIYDSATNSYKKLVDMKTAEGTGNTWWTNFKDRMYSAFGVIERFEAGKAYFNVPIKHLWAGNFTDNKFEANKVRLGDYGVVRNHIYDLEINSIKGLGTGIGDIDQPIVPPTEEDQYYIKTRLNILQWRVVKQNVDL